MSNITKFPPVEAELFHMGGQTDMMKLIVAFLNFSNAPKKTSENWVRTNVDQDSNLLKYGISPVKIPYVSQKLLNSGFKFYEFHCSCIAQALKLEAASSTDTDIYLPVYMASYHTEIEFSQTVATPLTSGQPKLIQSSVPLLATIRHQYSVLGVTVKYFNYLPTVYPSLPSTDKELLDHFNLHRLTTHTNTRWRVQVTPFFDTWGACMKSRWPIANAQVTRALPMKTGSLLYARVNTYIA